MKTKFNIKTLLLAMLSLLILPTYAQQSYDVLEIAKDESVKIQGGTINHLIINADKTMSGELIIEKGIVQVKKMTYRFQLKPTEWTMLTLPNDIANLNDPYFTNLNALGFTQNAGTKRYSIKRYNAEARANGGEPWVQTTTPEINANTAYLFYVVTGSTDMFDLEFYFDNVNLNSNILINNVLVDVDLTGKEVLKNYNVQITAANIKSNQLNIDVYNEPENVIVPVNHTEALLDAQILTTEEKNGFRIVLPNDEVCKVIIADSKLKKVFKAVEYVSPAIIKFDGLKRGKYKAILNYGPAVEVKDLTVPRIKK